jgi:uncharacterized protein YjbI with pentapeptide repeats
MKVPQWQYLLLWGGSFVVLILAVWLVPQWQVEGYNETLPYGEQLPPETLLMLENEYRKTLAQIIGGTALLVGLYFTYRRITAADRTVRVAQEGQITERITRAVEQLGATSEHGNKVLEVRLGGIYALERIARDSKGDHWPIVEILTAYVRNNASRQFNQNSEEEQRIHKSVRHPLVDLPPPSADVAAALKVIGRRNRYPDEEQYAEINLTNIDLSGRQVPNLKLEGVEISGANLAGAYLFGADLESAFLVYTNLEEANLQGANLKGACLFGTNLKGANLREANLQAWLQPLHQDYPQPNLEETILWEADLRGVDLTRANLRGAHLHYAQLEEAVLEDANLEGAHLTFADLRSTIGLTQEQIDKAIGDDTTLLPDNLKPPESWGKGSDKQANTSE